MSPTFHIEADLTFVRTEDGGKQKAVRSGYRAQFFYDGRDWDAVHEYVDKKEVRPGETAHVRLSFLSPEEHRGRVHPGMPFEVREGARTVARGVVTRLIDL